MELSITFNCDNAADVRKAKGFMLYVEERLSSDLDEETGTTKEIPPAAAEPKEDVAPPAETNLATAKGIEVEVPEVPESITPEVVTPTPQATTAPEEKLDTNGVPWNEEVCGGGRKLNKDGTWTKKRGVDREDYTRYVATYLEAQKAITEEA